MQQQEKQVEIQVNSFTLSLPRPDFGAHPLEHKLLAAFNENIITPDTSDCTAFVQWASANPTIYNSIEETERVRAATGNTSGYDKKKLTDVNKFFNILAAHPAEQVQAMAEMVYDPMFGNDPDRMIPRFVLLVRGVKQQDKKECLNTCMNIFMTNGLYMKASDGKLCEDPSTLTFEERAKSMYQPSSVKTMTKHLFAWFGESSIIYQQREFKNFRGSYVAAFDELCQQILTVRPDYGQPKQAKVDMNMSEKVRACELLDPWRPVAMVKDATKSSYTNLVDLVAIEMGVQFGPRSKKEPSNIMYSDLIFGKQQGGEYDGRDTLSLKGFHGADKTGKLGLDNVHQQDHSGYLKAYDDPDDPRSLVKMAKHYVQTHLQPLLLYYGKTDMPLFHRRAYAKQLKERLKINLISECGWDPNTKTDQSRWGGEYFTIRMREVAEKAGFEGDPKEYTFRSARRCMLTKMNAGQCVQATLERSGRHKGARSNVLYQDENESEKVHRAKCLQFNGLERVRRERRQRSRSRSRSPSRSSSRSPSPVKAKKKRSKKSRHSAPAVLQSMQQSLVPSQQAMPAQVQAMQAMMMQQQQMFQMWMAQSMGQPAAAMSNMNLPNMNFMFPQQAMMPGATNPFSMGMPAAPFQQPSYQAMSVPNRSSSTARGRPKRDDSSEDTESVRGGIEQLSVADSEESSSPDSLALAPRRRHASPVARRRHSSPVARARNSSPVAHRRESSPVARRRNPYEDVAPFPGDDSDSEDHSCAIINGQLVVDSNIYWARVDQRNKKNAIKYASSQSGGSSSGSSS